jgi:hypothetical protein
VHSDPDRFEEFGRHLLASNVNNLAKFAERPKVAETRADAGWP